MIMISDNMPRMIEQLEDHARVARHDAAPIPVIPVAVSTSRRGIGVVDAILLDRLRVNREAPARVDNVDRVCIHCGNLFRVNRYKRTQTCSRSCGAFMRWARRRERTRAEREALRAPSCHRRRDAHLEIGAGSVGGNGIGNTNRS
jgi:hypothetical protein